MIGASISDFINRAAAGELRLVNTEETLLALQLNALPTIVDIFNSDWSYVVVSVVRPTFVLTDNPTTVIGDWPGDTSSNIGVGNAQEFWSPLDPQHALVLSRDRSLPSHILNLPFAHARRITKRLILESHRWTVFQPGMRPLKGLDVPKVGPEVVWEEMSVIDRVTREPMEIVQTTKQRVHIEGECLLSGRPVVPFPRQPHKRMRDRAWIPDFDGTSPGEMRTISHRPAKHRRRRSSAKRRLADAQ